MANSNFEYKSNNVMGTVTINGTTYNYIFQRLRYARITPDTNDIVFYFFTRYSIYIGHNVPYQQQQQHK